jgi:YkoY family integral membrane protein
MFNQTLTATDFGTVGLLILLEALLSADNALILAIIVRHLPREQQKKALFYGLAGAFVLRLCAILIAVQIISFWWLQAIGAIYLLYLPFKHFLHHVDGHKKSHVRKAGFWMTVFQAEMTDIAFAVDSVLVAVAIEHRRDKVWVVYLGAICGVVLLRFAANIFLRILEKYPFLDHVAYALVAWAGVKKSLQKSQTI